jgi:thiosulfate/3-mercaptopyruvate sulfurtransferase
MTSYLGREMIVDGAWLAAHLDDPHLRVVDCGSQDAYRRAHISGALWSPAHPYKNPDDRLHVMEPEQFAAAMSELGIGGEDEVVAYDAQGSVSAGRLWWCLSYFGHQNVRVLDGGWERWVKEGRSLTMAIPKASPAHFTPQVDQSLLATADYVLQALSRPDTVILDVRTDGEWDGTGGPRNSRLGHIPGAVHLEWTNSMTPGDERCFKSEDELREMFEAAGITPEKEVITL